MQDRHRSAGLLALLVAATAGVGCPSSDAPACPAGQTLCGGLCFDLQADPGSCGTCLHACPTGAACQAGVCTCPAGQLACGRACVDPLTSGEHCGGCDQPCGPGACVAGACDCGAFAACTSAGPGEPRCADTLNDAASCGACGHRCRTGEGCTAGACGCLPGRTDYAPAFDACYDLQADENHCGACATDCLSTQVCDQGACRCPAGTSLCGTRCADTATDPTACGASCEVCASGASCSAGVCACPAARPKSCGTPATCVDLASDPDNCGACGTACASGQACTAATCCAQGELVCGTGAARTCCPGTACCGDGCQPAHSNGLGQSYFNGCNPLGTMTREAAQAAAAAWAPTGGTGFDDFCSGQCYRLQTTSQSAIWCFSGTFAGKVSLNTASTVPLCPPQGAISNWD
jgi:hypothetical protein